MERQFEETLDDLFIIAHSNATNIIQIDEDSYYYKDKKDILIAFVLLAEMYNYLK